MGDRRLLICALAFWLGYVLLLSTVPQGWPPDPSLPNVAAATGYNTDLAFLAAALWSILGVAAFGLAFERGALSHPPARPPAQPSGPAAAPERGRVIELVAIFLLFVLLYWPAFLVRYAPYAEDKFTLAALSRMQCGQLPYRDFEFLYGPVSLYPAYYWMSAFDFSTESYYALLALLEGALFASVLWLLQRYLPDRRWRYLAFALLVPFLLDTLLGLNWIAWRRILAVFVIVLVAARPTSLPAVLAAGAVAGLQIAYSLEYGAVGLIAALGIYGAMLLGPERRAALGSALGLVATAIAVWLATTVALTGATFWDYVADTVQLMERASRLGLGNFRFYWTVNSLALFGVLSAAVVAVGAGLFRLRRGTMAEGDRLLLGALVFALVALKIGLQRADVWHMGAPFLALVIAFFLDAPRRLFVLGRAGVRLVWGLIAVSALTTLIGLLPTGSLYASGLLRGAADEVMNRPVAGPVDSRVDSGLSERSRPDPDLPALAEYLADDARADRPVLFYWPVYWLHFEVGVCPGGSWFAPNLSSLYEATEADEVTPAERYLQDHPEAYVVMSDFVYRTLFQDEPFPNADAELSMAKRIGGWLSSPHHDQKSLAYQIEYHAWRRAFGKTLTSHERVAQFGPVVVLARGASWSRSSRRAP